MISYFIDTNYLLRLLLKENSAQHLQVYTLFQKALKGECRIFTSIIVMFEVFWVLSSFYKQEKQSIIKYMKSIMKMDFLEIENRNLLLDAINLFRASTLELEDCYNIYYFKQYPEVKFATFDRKILIYLK